MSATHRSRIASAEGLTDLHTSSVFEDMNGQPSLIPIFIGVYRRKEKYYRIIVNGSTGTLIGEAPLDWVKIWVVIITVVGIIFAAVNI